MVLKLGDEMTIFYNESGEKTRCRAYVYYPNSHEIKYSDDYDFVEKKHRHYHYDEDGALLDVSIMNL